MGWLGSDLHFVQNYINLETWKNPVLRGVFCLVSACSVVAGVKMEDNFKLHFPSPTSHGNNCWTVGNQPFYPLMNCKSTQRYQAWNTGILPRHCTSSCNDNLERCLKMCLRELRAWGRQWFCFVIFTWAWIKLPSPRAEPGTHTWDELACPEVGLGCWPASQGLPELLCWNSNFLD